MERLSQLAEIGADGERGGTTRPGLSVDEQRACELVAEWCEEEGLAVSWDAAGNLIARRPGARDGIPEVWSGSHLDTVPGGGRFDGALGVLAALEAVAALGSTPLAAPLAVVVFRDEEGWRFGRGFFGSRAVCGGVTEDELESADADGIRVRDALDELGLEGPPVAGPLPGTFVEVHVEQGPVLERAGHRPCSRRLDRRDGGLHGDYPRRRRPRGDDPDGGTPRRVPGCRRARDRAARCRTDDPRRRRHHRRRAHRPTGGERRARPRGAGGRRPGAVERGAAGRCWTPSRRPLRRPRRARAAPSISTGSG